MRVVKRVRGYARVIGQARRNRGDLMGWLGRRPQIAAATLTYETALLFSNKLDPRLKELAELKTAGLVACQFCLDIGSALAHTAGLTEQQWSTPTPSSGWTVADQISHLAFFDATLLELLAGRKLYGEISVQSVPQQGSTFTFTTRFAKSDQGISTIYSSNNLRKGLIVRVVSA